MSDVGQVAQAVTKISELVEGILSRADRDALSKELDENKNKIQNSFANNDLDEQWRLYYRLFNEIGLPPTPGGTVGETDREFRHSALFAAAQLKYASSVIARLVGMMSQKKSSDD